MLINQQFERFNRILVYCIKNESDIKILLILVFEHTAFKIYICHLSVIGFSALDFPWPNVYQAWSACSYSSILSKYNIFLYLNKTLLCSNCVVPWLDVTKFVVTQRNSLHLFRNRILSGMNHNLNMRLYLILYIYPLINSFPNHTIVDDHIHSWASHFFMQFSLLTYCLIEVRTNDLLIMSLAFYWVAPAGHVPWSGINV